MALRHHQPNAHPRDNDTDTDDDVSEESSLAPDLSRPPERAPPPPLPPAEYLLALTVTRLQQPPSTPPPLVELPGRPAFPRSSNASRGLARAESLASTMHRTRLQRRLQRSDLAPAETRSIAPFAGRRAHPSPPSPPAAVHPFDDTAVRPGLVKAYSAGLRRWADRPCFEDRLLVLLAEDVPRPGLLSVGEPRWTRVAPATACGVEALEFSVSVEILAGFYEDLPRETRAPAPAPAPAPSPSQPQQAQLGPLRLDTQLPLGASLALALAQSSPVDASPVSPSASSVAASPTVTASSSQLQLQLASAPPPPPPREKPAQPTGECLSLPLTLPLSSSPLCPPPLPPFAVAAALTDCPCSLHTQPCPSRAASRTRRPPRPSGWRPCQRRHPHRAPRHRLSVCPRQSAHRHPPAHERPSDPHRHRLRRRLRHPLRR